MLESIIGCKWSLSVMAAIRQGTNRPGAMQKLISGITTKVLNERLVKLTKFNILDKTIYPETPPRVEYHFTDFGNNFLQIIDSVEALQTKLNDLEGLLDK